MHRHLKIILVLLLFAAHSGLAQTVVKRPFQQKLLAQQEQTEQSQQEQSPPPEEEVDYNGDDAQTYDSTYAEDEAYAGDEATDEGNGSPFPEIITPPQRAERNIDDAAWSKMTSDDAYKYDEIKPEVKKKSDPENNWWSKMFIGIFEFLASTAGNYLIIGLVVLIILVIIIRIVQLNGNIFFAKRDKKLTTDYIDELSDEYIPDDWEKVIQEAAKAGNYRLAVRHGYRYLLSLLQQKEMIQYQVAKTNYQYVFELTGTPWHKPFMVLTRDYEYAWYGGFNIQQDRFEEYYRKVSDIKKELDQKG